MLFTTDVDEAVTSQNITLDLLLATIVVFAMFYLWPIFTMEYKDKSRNVRNIFMLHDPKPENSTAENITSNDEAAEAIKEQNNLLI